MNGRASLAAMALGLAVEVFSAQASATQYSATGQVAFIRIHDSVTYPISGTTTAVDRISVTGFSSAGTCHVVSSKVVIVLRDDERSKRMIALATAAMLAGKNVTVTVDDSQKGNTGADCILQHLTVGP